MDGLHSLLDQIMGMAAYYIPKVILAALTLFVGLWAIRWIVRLFTKILDKKEVEASLRYFLGSLTSIGLKVVLVISVASMVGIATTSFVAVLGAAGLAIGLALQGSLSNFAGGVLILLLKPYRVGDLITAQGHTAVVREIQIFYTILTTGDNQTIIIPNSKLSNDVIVNFSVEKQRRVDMVFSIGYGDDMKKAKAILHELINSDTRILKEPETRIMVGDLAAHSVDMKVRAWVQSEDYWAVFFDMQERVKEAFDAAGISIPFPQTDVHLYKHDIP